MTPQLIVILFILVALPIAWLFSEFHGRRSLRISLGLAAILATCGVAFVVGKLEHFNANAWYGLASAQLLDVTIAELESGRNHLLLAELRRLRENFQPTYENRARYDLLVEEYRTRIEQAKHKR